MGPLTRDAVQSMASEDGQRYATEWRCEGALHHSPNPLVLHMVDLGSEEVMLCGTCRDNFATLREITDAYDGKPPWPLRREFGNLIRALVTRARKATDV